MARRKKRSKTMHGRGKTWDKIKNGLSKANKFLKDTKVISKVAGELANAGVPYADRVHSAASRVGYGRRKKRRNGRRRARTHK